MRKFSGKPLNSASPSKRLKATGAGRYWLLKTCQLAEGAWRGGGGSGEGTQGYAIGLARGTMLQSLSRSLSLPQREILSRAHEVPSKITQTETRRHWQRATERERERGSVFTRPTALPLPYEPREGQGEGEPARAYANF